MGNEIDLVRYRNDGDDFHVLWTARRALRMLDPGSGLVAVAVEGSSEHERTAMAPVEPGLLVVDTAEYYGSENLAQATQVVYYQLKYSTTAPDSPWTVSGLKGTLTGFAQRYLALCGDLGPAAVADRIRFRFVSNRPISAPVQKAFAEAVARTPAKKLDSQVRAARTALLKATGLKVSEFSKFAAQVDLWGGSESRDDQSRHLGVETGRYTTFLDSDASIRMKELVRSKALSGSANHKTITRNGLLHQFGLGSERELFPAEPRFETFANFIPRAQETGIAGTVLGARWPVVVRAPGGVGKTVLAQRLGSRLPVGSEAIIFDGFAGGDYRNRRLYRHRHEHGLVQLANELARRGLCDILIPQHGASEQQYLGAFRRRVEQAVAVVRARSLDAVVLIVIDAADNLGVAAEDAQDRSFVADLMQEEPPEGCKIVALARPHRVEKYLKPADGVVYIDLDPFDVSETAAHLRSRFARASDDDVHAFHRFTDRNPRVQANALALADDLTALRKSLGPMVKKVEELIAGQLESALSKLIREQASSRTEIEPLVLALATLSPPVPVRVLAKAAETSEEAVRSFVSDFARGRPIVISDGSVQFRDEPVETWFRDNFAATPERAGRIADRLGPLAAKDAYVAAILPLLLHRAGRYDELMRLVLHGAEPEIDDPVERREVLLRRVQYALKAALGINRLDDAAKLLLRAGEEVATDDRQSGFLLDHADLVGILAGAEAVNDFIFRRRAWEISEKGYIYCAVMLAAGRRNRVEAERFLSLAELWLKEWSADQRVDRDDEPWDERVRMEEEDIAAYAAVIKSLHGSAAMIRFMRHWRDWAAFGSARIVVARLLDQGERASVEELLIAAGDRVAVRLAVIMEMISVCATPSSQQVRSTVDLLVSDATSISPGDYPEESDIWSAVIATAEAAARSGVASAKVQALLNRYPCPHERVLRSYDWGNRRDVVLRAAALSAALRGRHLALDEVAPVSIREALKKPGAEHDREVRDFKDIYGALVPWYGLRALALARGMGDWNGLVAAAQQECRSERWGWGNSPELMMAINEIGVLWLDAAIWAGHGSDTAGLSIEEWLADQRVMITTPTWTRLTRRAAHHSTSCYESAFRFARRARELVESEHGEARQTANSFAALARATLPLGHEEASGYFQKALEHLSRLGDELHERLFSILALAEKAGETGAHDPREAYRVGRIGELFHAYNDHKFPWHEVIEAASRLSPSSGFAIASRWNDRGQVLFDRTLPWLVLHLLEARLIKPTVAVALHAFGGYWQLRKRATLFLENEPDRRLRQAVLDTLAQDYEFDPDSDESAVGALLEVAERWNLDGQRLKALVDFHAQLPDQRSDRAVHRVDKDNGVLQSPAWSELLKDVDVHSPLGVDEATERRKALRTPSDPDAFLANMRRAVDPVRRGEHVYALARSQELMISLILDGLEACGKDWGASLALEKALADAVREMVSERAHELVGRGWALDETISRCAALSGLTHRDVLGRLMQGLADHVEHSTASALFNLARSLASTALTPEQAKDALAFGLDRLEPVLKEDDGDGEWREALAPPTDIHRAVAAFLYTMLASPEADTRWRAAHAVRRLCRFGDTQIVAMLVDLLPVEELPAFTDAALPFYALHARLYLLIALARAAEEAPEVLVPHVWELVRWACDGTPHVLIREFAARAALAVERHRPRVLDRDAVDSLTNINTSPFSAEPRKYGESGWSHKAAETFNRFTFDYDFDRYWLGALGDAFNLPQAEIVERAGKWIVDHWGKPNVSAWDQDPRARRKLYRGGTHATHGSYPSADRYSFYLSYHSMFCTAGELLAEFAPSISYGQDGWRAWLSRHLLTRADGKWLADGRDFEPLEARRWQVEVLEWEQRADWQYSVLGEDFDQALGINGHSTRELIVWGWRSITKDGRAERIRVSSALVTPSKSAALLCALQTATNPHNYKIPEEQDDLEVDLPEFQLCGWVSEPQMETGLDEFDPFAGDISWPGPRPGRRLRRLLKLAGGAGGRTWHSGDKPVMAVQVWGDGKDDRRRSQGNSGQRLVADLDFLLGMLARLNKDLIVEVEIEREKDFQEKVEIDFAFRPYTRIYLLRRDGRVHTLHRCHHLRPKAS